MMSVRTTVAGGMRSTEQTATPNPVPGVETGILGGPSLARFDAAEAGAEAANLLGADTVETEHE